MKKNYLLLAASLLALALSGCATMSTTDAMVPLQAETAKMLGLASSEELTITNVNAQKPDALGGQVYSYRATTKSGRIFDCSASMTPGILGAAPTISAPSCTAIKSHS
jgi:outer membrane lipoprotein SlyB